MSTTIARLVVLTGTGTEIGKTHVGESLLLAWRALGVRALGMKPVETGVEGVAPSDADRLAAASTFHVQHPLAYRLRTPVAPPLAARLEGVALDISRIQAAIDAARSLADLLLVELPGGLFSPLTDDLLNADLIAAISPDATVLVAPDRLGVLHDVVAATRAAASVPLPLDGIILVAPPVPDRSTGSNAGQLARFVLLPVLATAPRAPPRDLAVTMKQAARALLG